MTFLFADEGDPNLDPTISQSLQNALSLVKALDSVQTAVISNVDSIDERIIRADLTRELLEAKQ